MSWATVVNGYMEAELANVPGCLNCDGTGWRPNQHRHLEDMPCMRCRPYTWLVRTFWQKEQRRRRKVVVVDAHG